MAGKSTNKNYMTPNQVAELLMVTPAAVRQWAEKGDINALTTPGGHRRFLLTEVERFAKSRGLNLSVASSDSVNDRIKILIVEDDEFFSHYLKTAIQKLSKETEVEIVNNGFEAGIKVKEFKPAIVLLDLVMPGVDGFEVCKHLKDSPQTKNIRVIAMTSHSDEENLKRIMAAGAEICLLKPIDINTLQNALKLPHSNQIEKSIDLE